MAIKGMMKIADPSWETIPPNPTSVLFACVENGGGVNDGRPNIRDKTGLRDFHAFADYSN